METTTSTGVRGTALSGGPPTKAAGDGPPPLTGKTPAEALSASGEKPSAGDRPPRAAAAGAAAALLRSGEDGSISQEDAESLFKYLVDNTLAEKAEAFYGNYFVTPVLMAKTFMKGMYSKMGAPRFYIMAALLISMAALPIKMVLRWMFNLKYIVAIPEAFFNI